VELSFHKWFVRIVISLVGSAALVMTV